MSLLQAVILGLVQAFTEFLPISSSGHLVLVPLVFGWPDQGLAFDAALHVGTLFAVLVYFRSTIFNIIKSQRKLGVMIILSMIPAGLAGIFFDEVIETQFRAVSIIIFNLIFWGLILSLADWWSRKHLIQAKDLTHLKPLDAFLIGFAQMLALIPGTSRSGITMTAGLFLKLDKKSAAEFSFLMSIPVIGAAGALKMIELFKVGISHAEVLPLGVGVATSALGGLLAIKILLKIIQKWSFMPFVIYRILLGIGLLIYAF